MPDGLPCRSTVLSPPQMLTMVSNFYMYVQDASRWTPTVSRRRASMLPLAAYTDALHQSSISMHNGASSSSDQAWWPWHAGAQATAKKPTATKPKKRGPRPTTSGDFIQVRFKRRLSGPHPHWQLLRAVCTLSCNCDVQTVDPAFVEELKQRAAQEEAERLAMPVDAEADTARYNFHRYLWMLHCKNG